MATSSLRSVKPPHETRVRILEAAEELFMQHGFEGTSMRLLTTKAGVNLAAFAAFGIDKRKAVRRRWRIPEATLLGLCLLGGALGGLAGMHLFHHKTRKARFFVGVPVMLALSLAALALV